MLDKVKFEINEPVQITLRHPAGKIVPGRFGDQVYYSLVAGQCMYLSLDVAQKLNLLEPQAGETVVICKRNPKIWDVWLSPETEKMRAAKSVDSIEATLRASITEVNENRYATLRVPVVVGAGGKSEASAVTPAPGKATTATPESHGHSLNGNGITRRGLVDDANSLVDAYAAALSYASSRYGNQVKPEDVRALLTTVYINRSKGGAHAAA